MKNGKIKNFSEFTNNKLNENNKGYNWIYDYNDGSISIYKTVDSPFGLTSNSFNFYIQIKIINKDIIQISNEIKFKDRKDRKILIPPYDTAFSGHKLSKTEGIFKDDKLNEVFLGTVAYYLFLLPRLSKQSCYYMRHTDEYSNIDKLLKYFIEECNYEVSYVGTSAFIKNRLIEHTNKMTLKRTAEELVIWDNMAIDMVIGTMKKIKKEDEKQFSEYLKYYIDKYSMESRFSEVVNEIDDKDILLKLPLHIGSKISIHDYHKVNPDDLDDLDSYEF